MYTAVICLLVLLKMVGTDTCILWAAIKCGNNKYTADIDIISGPESPLVDHYYMTTTEG